MEKTWTLIEAEDAAEKRMRQALIRLRGMAAAPLAPVLAARGIDPDALSEFFHPEKQAITDPFLLKDLPVAADRLLRAHRTREKVLVFGDYDVDGVTAVALMVNFLRENGFQVEFYLPDRYEEGYGLSYKGIDFARKIGASVLVTLDCGIQSVEKVRYANRRALDVIICDHHLPGPVLPPALAVLDPRRADCPYPNKDLTGCGVGLLLCKAIETRLSPDLNPDHDVISRYSDLAALSIACDLVAITGENRTLAARGIQKLRTNPHPGLAAMMQTETQGRTWDISDLVFFVGPRINSAGRLAHAYEAVRLFLPDEPTDQLAANLSERNEARKGVDRTMTEEALSLLQSDPHYEEKFSTVLFQPHWHKGVIGIVASRVMEHHYRPTIMLTEHEGMVTGSARSVAGFDLYGALEACRGELVQFGGHKFAAGLTMRKEQVPAFQQRFEQEVACRISPELLIPSLSIHALTHFRDLSPRFVDELEALGPFGPGHMRPVFATPEAEVLQVNVMKEHHLRLRLRQDDVIFEAIGFFMAAKWEALRRPGQLAVAYQPVMEHWNGESRLRLRLKDITLPACLPSGFLPSFSSSAAYLLATASR